MATGVTDCRIAAGSAFAFRVQRQEKFTSRLDGRASRTWAYGRVVAWKPRRSAQHAVAPRASGRQDRGEGKADRRSASPAPTPRRQLLSGPRNGSRNVSTAALAGVVRQKGGLLGVVSTHRRKLVPMCLLFFLMAFANALLDSTADTLVVTALGGAEQIPFLSMYGVLPASVLFVMLFSRASCKLSRQTVFNLTIAFFVAFFGIFTGILYPLRESLHPHAVTDYLTRVLPASAAPGVAVLHNWPYTLFYIATELWGDVVLSLMFWRLASEITDIEEAHIIYPLFGLGANVAQCCAGIVLKQLHHIIPGTWDVQLRGLMTGVIIAGVCILVLHAFVTRRAEALGWGSFSRGNPAGSADDLATNRSSGYSNDNGNGNGNGNGRSAGAGAAAATGDSLRAGEQSNGNSNGSYLNGSHSAVSGATNGRSGANGNGIGNGSGNGNGNGNGYGQLGSRSTAAGKPAAVGAAAGGEKAPGKGAIGKPKMGLRETIRLLAASPQMFCLAAMSVAQGLSSNVFQVAWKRSIGDLFPNPADYSGFMGDVQTVSAVATGTAMLLAPLAFSQLGWRRTAALTPQALVVLGWAFFGACMWVNGGLMPAHRSLLPVLVLGGAAVYVFEKAAKFALLKPAEEMVYLGLDEHSRTNGKAAVDVCATQVGKAGGSLFQQGLLVGFGSLAAAMPALLLTHTGMVALWLHAVHSLAHHHGHLLGHVGGNRRRSAVAVEYTEDLACDLPPVQQPEPMLAGASGSPMPPPAEPRPQFVSQKP